MSHLMIDIEGLGVGPDSLILTIAAQSFDPFGTGYYDRQFYCRVDFESQEARSINQSTLNWWASQPPESKEEAFNEKDRVPLPDALDELTKYVFHHKTIWMNGPTYDATILENAYHSLNKKLPWVYYQIRDARTIYALHPDLPKPPTSHHALEDCRRQIKMLQDTFRHLNIRTMT
jgi:exodeoxyribonuclease VIII